MIQAIFEILPPILNVIFNLLLASYFFTTYYKSKKPKVLIPIFVIFSVLLFANVYLLKINILRIFIVLLCVFILSFAFEMTLSRRIIMSILYLALQVVSEMITIFLQIVILSVDVPTTNAQPLFNLGLLITYFVLYIILFINRRANHKIPNGYNKIFYILLSLPLATLLIIFTVHQIANQHSISPILSLFLLISSLLLVTTNFIVFYVADNLFDKIQYESRLRAAEGLIAEQAKRYSEILNDSTKLRQMRHDEINFCYGLLSSLKTNNTDDAIEQLTDRLDLAQNVDVSQEQEAFFETIIQFKENEALNEDIKLKTDIRTKDSDIRYNQIDMTILLGNLIDNAVDAVKKIPDTADRCIQIFIENIQSQLLISITNPTASPVDVTKLTTTKNNAQEHGFGLIAVRTIVEKYKGEIFFKYDNNNFEVSIVLN